MNHQPFEDWLLEESPLTPAEKRLLDVHLRECASCLALAEVSVALHAARPVTPPSGFVDRFRQRLAAREQAQRRKIALGFLILALVVLSALLILVWPFLSDFLADPGHAVLEWVSLFVAVCTMLQALVETFQILLRLSLSLVPGSTWTTTFLLLSTMCLVGMVSLAKLTRIPQGVGV